MSWSPRANLSGLHRESNNEAIFTLYVEDELGEVTEGISQRG